MSAWSIYHDGAQRRQEGDMTLTVKPLQGCFEWKIARFGAVIAGGKEWRSFQAKDAADKRADELKPAPLSFAATSARAERLLRRAEALLDGLRLEGCDDAVYARQLAEGLVMWPPRVCKEGVTVRHACKQLGIKPTFKAIRGYVAAEEVPHVTT